MQRLLPANGHLLAFPHLRFLLRAFCIKCASRPKLALCLPIRGLSFWLVDRPFFTSFRLTGPAGRLCRNADYKLRRQPPPQPSATQWLSNFRTLRTFGPKGRQPSRRRRVKRAIPQPSEPSEPFEPFEPSRRRRVQCRHHNPRPIGPSNLRTFGSKGAAPFGADAPPFPLKGAQ